MLSLITDYKINDNYFMFTIIKVIYKGAFLVNTARVNGVYTYCHIACWLLQTKDGKASRSLNLSLKLAVDSNGEGLINNAN